MMDQRIEGSFRDPSGFLYWHENELYRYIDHSYKEDYNLLMQSGLYQELTESQLLINHVEVDINNDSYKTIKPDLVPFISYPYEWSFRQLKDAALLTLKIQKLALKYRMSLKDCSAYNIQFKDGKAIFIDTLSFEAYKEGSPWGAYKQFCQHFLAPLFLMKYKDVRLNQLFRSFIDGIPLDIASSLLPKSSYLRLSALMHIHLHAKSQKKYEDIVINKNAVNKKVSKFSLDGLIDSLESSIIRLKWKAEGTEWVDYYNGDSYTQAGFEDKKNIVKEFLTVTTPKVIWDLGANDGVFSRIASKFNAQVVSFDIDPACVDNNYKYISQNKEKNILPLILDLTNPSGGIGWDNTERLSLVKRGPADMVMALALIHHLAISNNVPLDYVAKYFNKIGKNLIIEFVPKEDKKVQKLLGTREDIFPDYNIDGFERAFKKYFSIEFKTPIKDSCRVLYLMKLKIIS